MPRPERDPYPETWHFEYIWPGVAEEKEPCYGSPMTNHTDTLSSILDILNLAIDQAEAAPTLQSQAIAYAGGVDIVRSIVSEALDAEDEAGSKDLPESDNGFTFDFEDILDINVEELLSKLPGVGGVIFGSAPGSGSGLADLLQNLPDSDQIKDSLSGVFTAGDVPAGFQDLLDGLIKKPKQ